MKKTLFTILVLIFTALPVSAKDKIDVEFLSGKNLEEESLFKAEGILPGWSEMEVLRIENKSNKDDVNLYIDFDIDGDKTLGNELNIYVIQADNGRYRVGGEGDRFNLRQASKKGPLFIDRLSAGKGKEYRIKIIFDEDAGNEYQGLEIDFDIDFQIEAEVVKGEISSQEILAEQERVLSKETASIEKLREFGIDKANFTKELKDEKRKFPWWLILLLLLMALFWYFYKKYNKYKQETQKKMPKNK